MMKPEKIFTDQYKRRYVLRYVIAQQSPETEGKKIIGPMQGRYTYATKQEAQRHLDAIMQNNSIERLQLVYQLPLSVEVRRCYPKHYDPIGPYL